jgi:hypothetical protein
MKIGYHEECDAILATMLCMHQNDELVKDRGVSVLALLCDRHVVWMMRNRGNEEMVLGLCLTIIESADLITSTGKYSHGTFYKLTKKGIAFQLNDSFQQKKELEKLQKDLLSSQLETNENTRETNIINRWLLGGTTAFALLALLVSYLQYCIQSSSYQLELHKLNEDTSKVILQQENKLLQVKLVKTVYLFDSIKNSLDDSSNK